MYRGRTVKRRTNEDGSPAENAQEQQEQYRNNFLSFLDKQAQDAYKRPWHRMEQGLRLNRLRLYADEDAVRNSYSEDDKARLIALLTKAHDRKLLNSKSNVTYDVETERITEVKGLVMHRNSDGTATFRILDKKPGGITVRRKASTDKIEATNA
jgi:hypothetical protein